MRRFLDRPTKDFIKLGVIILFNFLVIFSNKDIAVKGLVIAFSLIYLISVFVDQAKSAFVNITTFIVLIIASSLLATSLKSSIGVESSFILLPGVISVFFGNLAIAESRGRTSKLLNALAGLIFLFVSSILILYFNITNPIAFVILIVIVVMITNLIIRKGDNNGK